VNGLTLSIGQILAVSITATAASIGAAGIPQEKHLHKLTHAQYAEQTEQVFFAGIFQTQPNCSHTRLGCVFFV
jgi:hypothetical protein